MIYTYTKTHNVLNKLRNKNEYYSKKKTKYISGYFDSDEFRKE